MRFLESWVKMNSIAVNMLMMPAQMIIINTSFVCLLLYQDLKDKTFLEVINKYVEVHATVGGGVSQSVSVSSTLEAFTMIRIYFLPLMMIVENFNSSDSWVTSSLSIFIALWDSVINLFFFSLPQSTSEVANYLPSFVINHGVITPMEVQKLLNESMVR